MFVRSLRRVFPTLHLNELARAGTKHLLDLLRWAREVRDYRRLAQMPPHLLDDIGVTHEEAEERARRTIWDLLSRAHLAGL